jgi:hypothetical protein
MHGHPTPRSTYEDLIEAQEKRDELRRLVELVAAEKLEGPILREPIACLDSGIGGNRQGQDHERSQ